MNSVTVLVCFVLVVCYTGLGVNGVSIENDLRITMEQKRIMDKFKAKVGPKLPHPYMREEIYLVRWLRARNFDLKKSEEFLLQNLRWRKQHRMDTIHEEDWSDMEAEFPHYIDGYDKSGQPIITAISREWDVRRAVVTGRIRRVLRYLDKAMDEATAVVRKLQLEGHNATQFNIILHMGHFNAHQHGCPRCITSILEFLDSYENHFPGMAHKISLVQTPPAFETIAQLVREAASPATREALTIYGTNPKVWKDALLKFINADQLAMEFGGTRPDPTPKSTFLYSYVDY